MLKSITLEVVGDQRLACEGCENRVVRVLKALNGVKRARAQASNQHIEVQFDPALLDASHLAEQLKNAGYETRIPLTTPTKST